MQHGAGIASEKEMKYTFMASHGGAASWFFLPYISCGQVMPLHRLRDLEGKIISLYPNSLNYSLYLKYIECVEKKYGRISIKNQWAFRFTGEITMRSQAIHK